MPVAVRELLMTGVTDTLAPFLGLGVPVAKSVALLPVSVAPPAARNTADVADGAGVGPLPSYPLAVLP